MNRDFIVKERGSGPLPRHIAIIMDGNGRWAKERGLPRIAGHEKGSEVVKHAVQACNELQIEYLTLYAFSSENWKRPSSEVDGLMGLLQIYLRHEIAELDSSNVKIKFIGFRERLSKNISNLLNEAERKTSDNSGLQLIIALDYGGHQEIVRATRLIATDALNGLIKPDDIDEILFSSKLETTKIPNPDLLIRTGGEKRLSNFLLWQLAYTELTFLDLCWPDVSKELLINAIHEFTHRDRRFGNTNE